MANTIVETIKNVFLAPSTTKTPCVEHVMLDIETLGKGNDACILSIGMVKFNPSTDEIYDQIYVAVEPESCQAVGLKMDASTVMWWMSDERNIARGNMMRDERVDLQSALFGVAEWFGDDKPVWGNGATFDNVILSSAFAACRIERPWKFWHDRCYRTLKSMAPQVKLVRSGVYHNALDDAISQAKHMQAVVKALGLVTL
jgi:exodeoxyribonuclease VIII